MENTSTNLSCGALSSMSPCSSTAFEASSSSGCCEGITTASERKIKESEGYLLSTSIDELDVDEGHQPAYVFMWATREGIREYEIFVKDYDCPINHEGSAGAMEASGVVRIFQKSAEKAKLCFTMYIGDGDTKVYPTVVKAEPYTNKQIVKGECVSQRAKKG